MRDRQLRRALAAHSLAGVALLCAQTGTAQTRTDAPVQGGDSQEGLGLQEIVVTAQRRAEGVQEVPISIQAFSGAQLQELGIKSSVDLAQFTPNVDMALPSGVGNQPIITIRGIGLNDYDTNNSGPNGVYADEVYLSNPSSQTMQTFDLQRIEVLKGPQGTLYGRNSSGGALNFISADPTDTPTAKLHADYSSYNTVNLEGAVSGPLADGLTGRLAFVENYSDGYLHNTFLDKDNGTQNWAARGILQYKSADGLKVTFNLHGGQVNNSFGGYQVLGDFVPGTQFNATPTECSVQQVYANQCVDLFGYRHVGGFYDEASESQNHTQIGSIGSHVRVEYTWNDLTLTSLTAFEHLNKEDVEDGDGTPNRLLDVAFGVQSNQVTQEFRVNQATENYNWVGGLYYLFENLHQNQPLYALLDGDKFFGPGSFDGIAVQQFDNSRQVTESYAGFGQFEYNLLSNLKLVLGGRYTKEHKSFAYDGSVQYQEGGINNFGPLSELANTERELNDSAFSWRTGLNYNIAKSVMVYASASTGFKSGLFNGTFLSTNPAEIARQLEPVAPEKVLAYEVGIKSSFLSDRMILNAAAFYNDYTNMQVFVQIAGVAGGSGLPLNVLDNAKKAYTEGLELTLVGKPLPELTLSAQGGLLKTKLTDFIANRDVAQPDYTGNQLPLAPHVSANLAADYRIPIGLNGLDLQVNANFKSHQFFDVSNDPLITQSGYWIANARMAYQFASDRYEVAAYVRNIANKEYYVDKFDLTAPFGFMEGVVGTPRFFGIEFTGHF